MTTTRRPLADGPAGIRDILGTLTALKEFYGTWPSLRAMAILIAGTDTDNDQAEQAGRLARFVKESLVYLADPLNTELIQTPEVLLLRIDQDGKTYGDCDDHVLLFASLAESIGIPCDIAGVTAPGSDTTAVNHVIAIAHLPGGPVQIDLCAKLGPAPIYTDGLIVPSP